MAHATNPVNWFEIPVRDLDRAKGFYEHVLQVTLSPMEMGEGKMAMFPMEQDAPGATGALMQSEGYTPSHEGSVVYFSVPDIAATLARAQEKGGKVLLDKTGIGEHGFIAQVEDCEGNRVALHALT